MNVRVITSILFIILLLTMTFGCVSNNEQQPVEVADESILEPTEELEKSMVGPNETELPPAPTTISPNIPVIEEEYDDEEFLIWLSDSMALMKNNTAAHIRQGNWGKTLKDDAGEDLIELEKFIVSPEYQEIAEKYGYALEAYQQAGYYAEGTTRTEGVPNMIEALYWIDCGHFQFSIMEMLLRLDTKLEREPITYNIKIMGHKFSPPIDMKIHVGDIVKWRNHERFKIPRVLISEDGLWEEPIHLPYMNYHEYTFNETGMFNFSLKYNEMTSRQTIIVT